MEENFTISCNNKLKDNKECNNAINVNKKTLGYKEMFNEKTYKKTKCFFVKCNKCGNEIIISEKLLDNETKKAVIKKADLERMDRAIKNLTDALDEYCNEK